MALSLPWEDSFDLLTAACQYCSGFFPPDFVVLLVEVALSDSSAGSGRDFGVLEVVTTEAGTSGEIRLSFILVKDNLDELCVTACKRF